MSNHIRKQPTSVGLVVADLLKKERESRIRLYGVLMLLFEEEVISLGKVAELLGLSSSELRESLQRQQW